jgi:hypothetical protein
MREFSHVRVCACARVRACMYNLIFLGRHIDQCVDIAHRINYAVKGKKLIFHAQKMTISVLQAIYDYLKTHSIIIIISVMKCTTCCAYQGRCCDRSFLSLRMLFGAERILAKACDLGLVSM